ncbi:ABC transporter ATP-binding protein, partial [Rhizobium johnstonii]
LRHGCVTGACDPKLETPASLAHMMVGSEVATVTHPERSDRGEVKLAVASLSVAARNPFAMALRDVSMAVRSGEILAIA